MAKTVEAAMPLMLMAVELLDKAGDANGAGKLREAIDAVRSGPGLTAADPPAVRGEGTEPAVRGLASLAGLCRRTPIT